MGDITVCVERGAVPDEELLGFLTPAELEALGEDKASAFRRMLGTPVSDTGLNTHQTQFASYAHVGSPMLYVGSPLLFMGATWIGEAIARRVYPGPPHADDAPANQVNLRHVGDKIQRRIGLHHPFVRFHYWQSIYWNLAFMALCVCTLGIGLLAWIPWAYFCVYATFQARAGRWYRVPLVGNWAYRKVCGDDP